METSFDPKKYWNDRLMQHYDLIGVGDISLSLNYNKWSYKVTAFRLKKIFKKYVSRQTGSILDIGSGTGFVIDIWQRFGKKINGIDISEASVKKLTEKYPDHSFFEV